MFININVKHYEAMLISHVVVVSTVLPRDFAPLLFFNAIKWVHILLERPLCGALHFPDEVDNSEGLKDQEDAQCSNDQGVDLFT